MNLLGRKSRRRRGMTMTETMMSVGVFMVVGTFMTAITMAVGREANETIQVVPAEQQAYRAMDFIRRELLPARVGSVNLSQDGSSMTFINPSRGTTSRIFFDSDKQVCVFIPNVSANQRREWGRGITGTFTRLNAQGTRFRVEVNTQARNRNGELVTISYRDDLTLRN